MPCFHPINAYQPHGGGPISFRELADHNRIELPCGACDGCRMRKSREWAIRCTHEAQMHKHNSFVTLTYNDEHLPRDYSLDHSHFAKFARRLRRARGANTLRYYMAGEYGEENGRPHYHAILFGIDFPDKVYLRDSPTGEPLYRSDELERLWPFGYSSIGEVNFKTTAYVARYVLKKQNEQQLAKTRHSGRPPSLRSGELPGEKNQTTTNIDRYTTINLTTGELIKRKKEYNMMSRRPGIGSSWLAKYAADVYTTDTVIHQAGQDRPPRYYDKLYAEINPQRLEELKHERYKEALAQTEHHTPERLAVQEQVHAAKINHLKRKL